VTDHARDSGSAEASAEPTSSGANGSDDRLASRLRAVERAVAGSEARPDEIAAGAEATAERERLESRIADLEERVAELEAATQAVRGYAGAVRAVNREVERRADLALSRATTAARAADGAEGRGVAAGSGGGDPQAGSGGGDPPAGDREIAAGSGNGNAASGAVPSESALDAALPDDRPGAEPRGDGGGDRNGGGGDRDGGDGNAWATDALDRLRESL
jgi:hypothetical protein